MKIGIDYKTIVGDGGIKIYLKNLVAGLADLDKDNEYYLYQYIHDFLPGRKKYGVANKNFKPFPAYFSRLGFKIIPNGLVEFFNSLILKILIKFYRVDVFHVTNPLHFVFGLKNTVVTIHDMSVLYNEDWAKNKSVDFYKKNINKILRQAKRIIAVSHFTKNEIIKFFHIDENKISVIYEGVGPDFYPDEGRDYLFKKFGIRDYILYVGQLQPRKNIIGLIEAYGQLPGDLRLKYNLIIIGAPQSHEFLSKVKEKIAELKLEDSVKILGWVETADLRKFFTGAKFFIYLSFLEGFGLPILESFSCGTPVITSSTSSLPEVAGDQAAILVDPNNSQEIKAAMECLLTDEEVYQRLKSNCRDQLKKFSWEIAARETLSVYNQVKNKNTPGLTN